MKPEEKNSTGAKADAQGDQKKLEIGDLDHELTLDEMSHKAGGAAYLKFDGIKGESMDDKHKSEIELLSAVQALPVVIKIV